MYPRGIDEEDLGGGEGLDPQDTVPGGLGLGRDDSDLLSHEAIEKGGFAYIGPPDDGNDARAEIMARLFHPPPLSFS